MIHKISLDNTSLKEIIRIIHSNNADIIVFYNDQLWSKLNKQLIFSLIVYIQRNFSGLSYYFYNIPFCLFKKLWKNFIENHCILNRLCNYYEWYVSNNICNKCTFGLFCNNFNSRIDIKEMNGLEWFQEEKLINKEVVLEKIHSLYLFVISLWYKEEEVSFYTRQKFMVDFLEWNFLIPEEYLKYFTVYFLVGNIEITNRYFIDATSFSLVFKEAVAERNAVDLAKRLGINMNLTFNKEKYSPKNIIFEGIPMRLNYYFSVEKDYWKKTFFDFHEKNLAKKQGATVFSGIVLNKKELIIRTSVKIIKKAWDLYSNGSDIYMGRDMISWLNINNYKWILLTSDDLGEYGRLGQSLKSIRIPIIYDITPNILETLKDGDIISIDFNSWLIQKCI